MANLLLSSLISMLGLGSCKTSSKVDNLPKLISEDGTVIKAKKLRSPKDIKVVYGPPPSYYEEEARREAEREKEYAFEQERLRKEQEARERKKREEEMKVVYGPPVARNWQRPMPDTEGIYDIGETAPQFPGGPNALVAWIEKNIQYPKKAREEGIGGRVIVNFIIRPDGSVDGAMVVRRVDPQLDAEALRLVK